MISKLYIAFSLLYRLSNDNQTFLKTLLVFIEYNRTSIISSVLMNIRCENQTFELAHMMNTHKCIQELLTYLISIKYQFYIN